ncbi:hypothetical protein JYU12_01990 [bacterium AH-315-K03]|nr:hypothetical protein [bacterium AH-315-K03]
MTLEQQNNKDTDSNWIKATKRQRAKSNKLRFSASALLFFSAVSAYPDMLIPINQAPGNFPLVLLSIAALLILIEKFKTPGSQNPPSITDQY